MQISMQIAAIALALNGVSLPAHSEMATDSTTQHRVVIHFGDLELNTEHDAKTMMRRINNAATKACGGEHSFSSYTGGPDDRYQECRETIIHKAVEQLGAPLVSRLYSQVQSSRSNTRHFSVADARN